MVESLERRNIIIITPFYPILHRDDLNGDTKAVYYLLRDFSSSNNLLVIHTFLHRFRSMPKHLFKIFPLSDKYLDYLFKDKYNNKVLFFENILFLPKTDFIINYFNKKYSKIIGKYCTTENFIPDIGVVHFPTYFKGLMKKLNIFSNKIAILHSVDIKKVQKSNNSNKWSEYFNSFDAIGFRSYVIKKEFERLITYNKPTFICLSGIPENLIHTNLKIKGYSSKQLVNILYAGKIDKNKNVDKVILALSKLHTEYNFVFNILGTGNEVDNNKKLAKNMGIYDSVNFIGPVSREAVFEFMQTSDIFIMVSKKETLGLVYLEAMAAGCIVIGSKGQGIDGVIIDGHNGFLAESSSLTNIIDTIKKVICLNEEKQIQIKTNAKETIARLSEKELSNIYFNNICSVFNQKS